MIIFSQYEDVIKEKNELAQEASQIKIDNYKIKSDYDKLLNDIVNKTDKAPEKDKKAKKKDKKDDKKDEKKTMSYEDQIKEIKIINKSGLDDGEKITRKKDILKDMENENYQISQKIESQKENQEQLILLVKIIQKSGVDVEELIDKWNNEVEKENANLGTDSINTESIPDSTNELNSKIDPSSFIPINIEKPLVNKKVFKGIPKLNFDILGNGQEKNKKMS